MPTYTVKYEIELDAASHTAAARAFEEVILDQILGVDAFRPVLNVREDRPRAKWKQVDLEEA